MPVVPFRNFSLADRGMSWSFTAEDGNRLIENGGWKLFKRVHTWFDDSEGDVPENKGSYKLPHHKYVGDEVKTVWRGVVAAMVRLMQVRTQIPDDDRRGCYNHLSKHYREFDEDPPEFRWHSAEELRELLDKWGFNEDEANEMIEQQYSRAYGTPTASQLAKINAIAKRPLSKEEVFVFPDKLAGDMVIPDRYIQIHKTLLNVFKNDAKSGVSLLLDHPWAGFGRPKPAIAYGRTFDSVLRKSDIEGEEWELVADHYIVRGKEIDGIKTDFVIASIEDGTFFDTSIGWGASAYECSICGNDIRYLECGHFLGQTYDGKLCYAIAKPPGFLMENSIVFDGAYPGAGILSSVGDVKAGEMLLVNDFKNIAPEIMLYHAYSARRGKILTFARREDLERKVIVMGAEISKGGEAELTEEQKNDIYLTRDEVKEALGEDIEPEGLLIYASEGRKYLNELKQEAEKWGIRSKGDKYNKEAWRTRYELMSADELKNIIETFKAEAEMSIPAGRQTEPGLHRNVDLGIPNEAYKA